VFASRVSDSETFGPSDKIGRVLVPTLRATVLCGLWALLTFIVLGCGSGESSRKPDAASQDKPNIIFVLTDDQFPGTENRMPFLNTNITNEGVKFTNMVSTFPLCCPARATIQRGQYPHNTQILGNALPRGGWQKFKRLGEQNSTIATWLNHTGYHTGLFGKYMNNYTDLLIPPGWDRWYAWNGPYEGWTSVNDQGTQKPLDWQEADSLVADEALEFLGNGLKAKAPLFAFVNFGAMHKPYFYARIDAQTFEGEKVPRTPAFNEDDVSDKPEHIRKRPKLSSSDISELDTAYQNGLRSLMRVDRFIEKASELLRREGEMDNTYFVFYTDNGVHFGQHRLMPGKLEPYEEDVNFPLIVRGPGIPHGVIKSELVGNHDIAPTLADMGGADVPAFVDGRSFLPLAKGTTTVWPRTAVLSERARDVEPPNKWDMLRMSSKVYIRHENGMREYYDLAADPYQLHNAFQPDDPDKTPPAPRPAIKAYYEQRLNALYECEGQRGPGSCGEAEDAPLLPGDTTP
jgi:N-acetylglucosamine-6-sulfatase